MAALRRLFALATLFACANAPWTTPRAGSSRLRSAQTGRSWHWPLVFAALALLGCPSQQLITEVPKVEDADDQQATCKVARDPLNPLVVEWPGTAKVDLESVSRRGLVAVSYAGCTMKILTSCEIEGSYDLERTTPARDRIEISNNSELYAKLPLGAAALKAELSGGTSLSLDYVAVGQRVAAKPPEGSRGDCGDATHYVRTITIGAFSLDARAQGKVGASAEIGSAGGGIGRKEDTRNLKSQGDIEVCSKKPDGGDCGAILQLGLAPLNKSKGQAIASAGFGAGLDPVAQLEAVDLAQIDSAETSNLANVDVDLYELLDTAVRAEKNEAYSAADRVRAWEALANYRDKKGKNPLQSDAEERVEAWKIRDAQEQRQKEAMNRLRDRYLEDKQKLQRLLALGDSVIKPEQKVAYQAEFDEVYGARRKELASMGLVPRDGDDPVSSSGGGSAGNGADTAGTGPTQQGLAGFGFFQIDVDLAVEATGVSADDTSKRTIREQGGTLAARIGDDGEELKSLSFGPVMIGAMISTPELLPRALCKTGDCFEGGFGLYGAFKGFLGGDVTTLAGSGGGRFDYRFSEGFSLHLGGGGGFASLITGEYQTTIVNTDQNTATLDPDGAGPEGPGIADCNSPRSCGFNLSGPLGEVLAGLSFGDRSWSFGLRTSLLFLFPANTTGGFILSSDPASNPNSDLGSSMLTLFNFGGHLGIVL
jgi:hypothetical protein